MTRSQSASLTVPFRAQDRAPGRSRSSVVALVAIVLSFCAFEAQARSWSSAAAGSLLDRSWEKHAVPNNLVRSRKIGSETVSLERATAVAREATGGRVLSAKPLGADGYRVRVLTEGGRVRTVHVNARGQITNRN